MLQVRGGSADARPASSAADQQVNIVLLGEAAVRKDSLSWVDEAQRVVGVAEDHRLDWRLACPLKLVDFGLEVLQRLWAGRLNICRKLDCYWLDEGPSSEIIVEAVCGSGQT